MEIRAKGLLSIAIFLILLTTFAHADPCIGENPPCDNGLKQCADPTEICTEISGVCECIPAVCPTPGERTYLDALYTNENNEDYGNLEVELYFIEADTSGKGVVKPVEGGLIIIDSGRYVTGSSTYTPAVTDEPLANKACKAFADEDGMLNIKLKHPQGGMKIDHRIIFCPYVENSASGQNDLAICARLLDENGNLHESIDYSDIPNCDDSWTASMREDVVVKETPKKIWDGLVPAETSVSAFNNSPPTAQVTFCWSMAIVFGLLLAASFTAGKNPLMFFDLNAARSIKMNRTAGQYQPMNQMVSINVEAALNTVYSAAKTAQGAMSEGEVKTDENGNVVDSEGNKIMGANGKPLKVDKDGNVVDSGGNKVDTSKLSTQPARDGAATRMEKAKQKAAGGVRGALMEVTQYGVEKVGKIGNSEGTGWGGVLNSAVSVGLVGLVEGAVGGFAGGGIGKGLKNMSKGSLISTIKRAAQMGAVEGLSAVAPTEDYSDAGPQGGEAVSPLEAANQLKSQVAEQLGLTAQEASQLKVVKVNGQWIVKGEKGSSVEKVRANISPNGQVTINDKYGTVWMAEAFVGENKQLELSSITRAGISFGGGGSAYQVINGVTMTTGGSGEGFMNHLASIVDTAYRAVIGEASWANVGNTALQPLKSLVLSFTGGRKSFRVENSHRDFKIDKKEYSVVGNDVMQNDLVVGTYDKGEIKFDVGQGPTDGHTYKLDRENVLDITSQGNNPRIMPGEQTEFTLGDKTFIATPQDAYGVQSIIQIDSNGNKMGIEANIHRDENGNITAITDSSGKEKSTLSIGGTEFSVHVGISAPSGGYDNSGNLNVAEPLHISTVGKVEGATAEGWKADIYDVNGRQIVKDGSIQEAYLDKLRVAAGLSGTDVATQQYQEQNARALEEQMEIQKKVSGNLGIDFASKDAYTQLKTKREQAKNKLPSEARDLPLETLVQGADGYTDEYKKVVLELVQIEAADVLLQRTGDASIAAQQQAYEIDPIKKIGSGLLKGVANKLETSMQGKLDAQLEIASAYSDMAQKIENGYEVTTGDLTKLNGAKQEFYSHAVDTRFYSAATRSIEGQASLSEFGIKKELAPINAHISKTINEYEKGASTAQSIGKMDFILEGVVRMKDCNSKEEVNQLGEDMNHILSGGAI